MTRLLNSRRDFGRISYYGKDQEKVESDQADFKGGNTNGEILELKYLKRKDLVYYKFHRRRNQKRSFGEKKQQKSRSHKIRFPKKNYEEPNKRRFQEKILRRKGVLKRVITIDTL